MMLNPSDRQTSVGMNVVPVRTLTSRRRQTRAPGIRPGGDHLGFRLVDGVIVVSPTPPTPPVGDRATVPTVVPTEPRYTPETEPPKIRVAIAPRLADIPSTRWTRVPLPSSSGNLTLQVDEGFAERFAVQLGRYYAHRARTLDLWVRENPTHEGRVAVADLREVILAKPVNPSEVRSGLLRALYDPKEGLYSIIGRSEVKKIIETTLKSFAANWKTFSGFTNILLFGGPGTGKTSLARLVAWVYGNSGLLETTKYSVVTTADLVAQYMGQSAPNMRRVYLESLGGVLFIDEAYQIRGEKSAFGDEVITELVNLLDKLPYVTAMAAGYEERMKAHFLGANEGLARRFPRVIKLEPFSELELAEVCVKDLLVRLEAQVCLSDLALIRDCFASHGSQAFKGQAGDAINISREITQEFYAYSPTTTNQRGTIIADVFASYVGRT